MPGGMTCDYTGCSNQIQLRCDRCGGAYCVRHVHSRHDIETTSYTSGTDRFGDPLWHRGEDIVVPRVLCLQCHEKYVVREAEAVDKRRHEDAEREAERRRSEPELRREEQRRRQVEAASRRRSQFVKGSGLGVLTAIMMVAISLSNNSPDGSSSQRMANIAGFASVPLLFISGGVVGRAAGLWIAGGVLALSIVWAGLSG